MVLLLLLILISLAPRTVDCGPCGPWTVDRRPARSIKPNQTKSNQIKVKFKEYLPAGPPPNEDSPQQNAIPKPGASLDWPHYAR